jgi:hypothetical protein
VNSSGEPSTYSSDRTRLQRVAESLMKPEIEAAANDIRKRLAAMIDESFRATVVDSVTSAIGLNLKPKT